MSHFISDLVLPLGAALFGIFLGALLLFLARNRDAGPLGQYEKISSAVNLGPWLGNYFEGVSCFLLGAGAFFLIGSLCFAVYIVFAFLAQ